MANSLSGLVGLTVGLPCSQVGTLLASVALMRIPNLLIGAPVRRRSARQVVDFVHLSGVNTRSRTTRYVCMLATLRRDELIRDGRGEEAEKLIAAAREVQGHLQDSARK